MARMSLWDKYKMLFGKVASAKSCDFSRATIYQFEKYCKCCGAGMKRPAIYNPRPEKKLWKFGFCSEKCEEKGAKRPHLFIANIKAPTRMQPKHLAADDMVSISKALDEQERRLPPFVRIIREADYRFESLSEKLSFMEMETQEKWQKSRWFYWARRVI